MVPAASRAQLVAAVIPAKDEAERIAATVAAVRQVAGIDMVVVVDDGSTDDTAGIATAMGAVVARHKRNKGKAAAMMTGARRVEDEERSTLGVHRPLLFVDADLEASAANLGVLITPVTSNEVDMTIATLPPQRTPGGGHGFVVRLARNGVKELTGFEPVQPLSGMRCISREAFTSASPLARGWGVEVALTIDVLRAGLRVREVPCDLRHRVSGANWRGQLHRARQYRDVAIALGRRLLRRWRR